MSLAKDTKGKGGKDTQKQGKRRVETGEKTRRNREKDRISLESGGRPHKLGRAPLYLGAPTLIYPSGRSKPVFNPY